MAIGDKPSNCYVPRPAIGNASIHAFENLLYWFGKLASNGCDNQPLECNVPNAFPLECNVPNALPTVFLELFHPDFSDHLGVVFTEYWLERHEHEIIEDYCSARLHYEQLHLIVLKT